MLESVGAVHRLKIFSVLTPHTQPLAWTTHYWKRWYKIHCGNRVGKLMYDRFEQLSKKDSRPCTLLFCHPLQSNQISLSRAYLWGCLSRSDLPHFLASHCVQSKIDSSLVSHGPHPLSHPSLRCVSRGPAKPTVAISFIDHLLSHLFPHF